MTPFTYLRLGEALQDADLVVLGVNSSGVNWAADMLGSRLAPAIPIIMLTKGLAGDGKSVQILPDILRLGFPVDTREAFQITAIGGPSIVGELAARRHTCILITGPDQHLLEELAVLLRTPYYHVWTSTDMVGSEVCVALKNLYSLAIGMIQGLLEAEGVADNGAVMHNLAATIFAQGMWETAYLVNAMGGELTKVYSLPEAGDLYVTSQGRRNLRMGRLMGLGMAYQEAKAGHMPDDTIEGAELALAIGPTIEAMIDEGALDPASILLLRRLVNIVCLDSPREFPWDEFFAGA